MFLNRLPFVAMLLVTGVRGASLHCTAERCFTHPGERAVISELSRGVDRWRTSTDVNSQSV